MSSSTGNTPRKTKTGYDVKEINAFLQRGSNLAANRDTTKSISDTAPEQKTRFFDPTYSASKRRNGQGIKLTKTGEKQSGFMGQFSDMSEAELQGLASKFKQRETNINQRRLQPGRSALFFGRS